MTLITGSFQRNDAPQRVHINGDGRSRFGTLWNARGAQRAALVLAPCPWQARGVAPPGLPVALAEHGIHVLALDGDDSADDATRPAARWLRERTGLSPLVMGSVFGAAAAFAALLADDGVGGAVLVAPVMPAVMPLRRRWRVLQGRLGAQLGARAPGVGVPLGLLMPCVAAALCDPAAGAPRARVPLHLAHRWLTARLPWPAGANVRPVLFVVGERDEVVPPAHVLGLYMATGGRKHLEVLAGAGHHLALEEPTRLAAAVANFVDRFTP